MPGSKSAAQKAAIEQRRRVWTRYCRLLETAFYRGEINNREMRDRLDAGKARLGLRFSGRVRQR